MREKWHKDAPRPRPATRGERPEPFHTRVPVSCPRCGALVSFFDTRAEAAAYVKAGLPDHPREFCERAQAAGGTGKLAPKAPKKTSAKPRRRR